MDDFSAAGSFTHVMRECLMRSGYNACQVARLAGLPRRTVANWHDGVVTKPRNWLDVVKLARALRLPRNEANKLLAAAGYPPLAQLQQQAKNEAERGLFAFWAEAKAAPEKRSPFQVIPDLPTFVGREEILQTVQTWLLAGQHTTPYVLEGTAGVGKTVLAAKLAYRLRDQFPDGVLWARPDSTNTLMILHQFAEAVGRDVTRYEDVHSRSAIVRELLADKRALIVLDNVPGSEQLEPLLPPSGSCAVLITSRRRQLAAIPDAHRLHVTEFAEAESLALFSNILGEASVVHERAVFVELAELLGHLPLAIDIAASRLAYEPGWTVTEFLTHLKQEKSLLNTLIHEGRSLQAAFESSFNLLSAEQQRFFATMSTFGGADFSAEAAAASANIPVNEATAYLQELFCLSLVRRGRPYHHYRLIPAMQTLAEEKLQQF
ncbi:MAG: hypothetical protein IT327_00010 [Anaerolineae bacterium]|nr:hypothetical protein [Anaerolineae bacterium]